MNNKFPVYYASPSTRYTYKIDGIHHIDIKNNKIYYSGDIVYCYMGNHSIKEYQVFLLPDDIYQVSEDTFYDDYNYIMGLSTEAFPQYYYYPKTNEYFKLIVKNRNPILGYTYYGVSVNSSDFTINGSSRVADFDLKNGSYLNCLKEEYEEALNTVINKIK